MITAWIGIILFSLLFILYLLLVLKAPLGDFAMGGRYKVLPKGLRIACGVSLLVQAIAIAVLLELGGILSFGLPRGTAKGFGFVFGSYLIFNVFMNLKSKSIKEKLVMTPISAALAFCFLYTSVMA